MTGLDRMLLIVVACTVMSGIAYLLLASSPTQSSAQGPATDAAEAPVPSAVPDNANASTLGVEPYTRDVVLDTWRLSMSMRCRGPERVQVGSTFDLSVRCANTGDLELSEVIFSARASDGLTISFEDMPEREIAHFEADTQESFRVTCSATKVGTHRISAFAREARGWAAAGVILEVIVQEEPVASQGTFIGRRLALSATLETLDPVEAGKKFRTRTTFKNEGDLDFERVRLGWAATGGVQLLDPSTLRTTLDTLPAGSSKTFMVQAMAPSPLRSDSRVKTSFRDRRGWAAAGALLALSHED